MWIIRNISWGFLSFFSSSPFPSFLFAQASGKDIKIIHCYSARRTTYINLVRRLKREREKETMDGAVFGGINEPKNAAKWARHALSAINNKFSISQQIESERRRHYRKICMLDSLPTTIKFNFPLRRFVYLSLFVYLGWRWRIREQQSPFCCFCEGPDLEWTLPAAWRMADRITAKLPI